MNQPACAIYHRVSTVDQDPTIAARELRAAARARGYTVPRDLHVEETGSGRRNDRPGLQRVMAAARAGRIAAVLVWKLDRFGRSALDVLTNVRALRDAGVRFVATSQGIEIVPDGDATSQLTLTLLAAFAEFERELIAERTRAGLDAARRRGKQLGRRPHAEASAAVVRDLAAQNMPPWAIAEALGCSIATVYRRLDVTGDEDRQIAKLDQELAAAYRRHNAAK